MIPQTIGQKYSAGRIVPVLCIKNDRLEDIEIIKRCFLMIIIYEGNAVFRVKDVTFNAIGPCFVCFDEKEQPILVKKHKLKCDSIYFHPTFLNVNMTFDRIHDKGYEELALTHDMFLLKPFCDDKRFVFPVLEEYLNKLNSLFLSMENELKNQQDWYWSCRSRSYFIELILILERAYGTTNQDYENPNMKKIKNPYLEAAVSYIESNYRESITLDNITKSAAMCHSSLTKLFKSELNTTPIKYLWQYRLDIAKKHLEFTNLPIKGIALNCGFKTVQHFSRKFEEYTSKTPTDFRNEAVKKRKAAFSQLYF